MSRLITLFLASIGCQHGLTHRQAARREVPSLCKAKNVAEACSEISGVAGARVVNSEQIADTFRVSHASVGAFLEELGFSRKNIGCMGLCKATISSFPQDVLPPAVDVGCVGRGASRKCDVDLSREGMAQIAMEMMSNRPIRKEPQMPRDELTTEEKELMEMELMSVKDATFAELQKAVANWFRVWPSSQAEGEMSAAANAENTIVTRTTAYCVNFLKLLSSGQADTVSKKWLGSSVSRTRVQSGVNHIQNVMRNPFFIAHPNEKSKYGWVYSPYTRAANGTWPIHLGGAYYSANTANKIGTMTHEAAHFFPLGTDDKLYCDVRGCLSMAQTNPTRAQQNADSWSYMIDEVNGRGMQR